MEKSGNGFGKYEAEKRKSRVNTRKGRAEIGKSRVDKGNGRIRERAV